MRYCLMFLMLLSLVFARTNEVTASTKKSVWQKVLAEAKLAEAGYRIITYEQFVEIYNSKEEYTLLDVRLRIDYNHEHIEGAESFPFENMTDEEIAARFPEKDAKIVVYCSSSTCDTSDTAAHRLTELRYTQVLEYDGGIKEWKEKGNKVIGQ